MLNAPTDPRQVQTDLTAGDTGTELGESLITEEPAALDQDYAHLKSAVADCHSLTVTGSGISLAFALTPITFGGPGSAADRMDGAYNGVQVNGYLAVERLGDAAMAYAFFQVGSGSSQLAHQYYTQAVDKVNRVLGGTAGTAASAGGITSVGPTTPATSP